MKKKTSQKTIPSAKLFPWIPLVVIILAVLFLLSFLFSPKHFKVLGEQTSSQETKDQDNQDLANKEVAEKKEAPEPKETPEPSETPEQEAQHARETEKIHNEVKQEIDNNNIDQAEIQPASGKMDEGKIKLEKTDGTLTEKIVPASNASVISVASPEAGVVSLSVNKNGTVTLANNGINVQTNYPVVIDPRTQSISIRTPKGIVLVNLLPSQALNKVGVADKPTLIQTAVLNTQNGEAYYDIAGIQQRKFLGLLPVNAKVETKINAQNGEKISVEKPWYLNALGFLYTTI